MEIVLARHGRPKRASTRPGDKLFVDYAGKTMALVDRHTGEIKVAQRHCVQRNIVIVDFRFAAA